MTQTALTLSAITLLLLTSCAKSPTSSVPSTAAHSTIPPAKVEKLQKKLSQTKAATDAGDFVIARQEFSQFEALWKTVKDDVEAASSNDYVSATKSIDAVRQALNANPLSRERVVLALKALETSLASASKA